MLSDYKGTLLLISHDRAFMDNSEIPQLGCFDGKGTIDENRWLSRLLEQRPDQKKWLIKKMM